MSAPARSGLDALELLRFIATLAATFFLAFAAHADDEITLRVNDTEAAPGGIATVVLRTYAPRPIGQGQISLGTTSRPKRFATAPNSATRSAGTATAEGSPFSEFLGGEVLSGESDANVSFDFAGTGDARLEIRFSSPSGTVNETDGPLAVLRFRVRDDLADDSEYELFIEDGASVTAPNGTPLPIELRSGRLAIEGDGDGGGGGGGDAGQLRFDLRSYHVTESAGAAVVTLERSGGDDGSVSVAYLTRNGSAGSADYQSRTGTVTWADDDESPKTFVVPLVDDALDEPSETVLLELESPTGGAGLDFEHSTAVLTIADDDEPADPDPSTGKVRFAATRLEIGEAAATFTLAVERADPVQGAGSVDWQTVDGSAERGLDYQQMSGTLSWGDGEGGARTLEVPLLDDELDEGNESLRVVLVGSTGGVVLDPAAREAEVELLDDDAARVSCTGSDTTLCLQGGRFAVEVLWFSGSGASGRAQAVPDLDASGMFWFFERANVEMLVKVLDGCGVAGLEGWWVFYSATTDLGLRVTITDTATGQTKEYHNQPGTTALPVQDFVTFRSCGAG